MAMIRCSKCGRVYDYDKYNGICPNCARYNRPNTGMGSDEELHRKYDSTPYVHTSPERTHSQVHRENYDSYSHKKDEYSPNHGTYGGSSADNGRNAGSRRAGKNIGRSSMAGGTRKSNRTAGIIICVLVLVLIVVIGLSGAGVFDRLFEENVTTPYSKTSDLIQEYDEYYTPILNVEYFHFSYVGEDPSNADWYEIGYSFSDEEQEEMDELAPGDGIGTYYLLNCCFYNSGNTDFDTTEFIPEDFDLHLKSDGSVTLDVRQVFYEDDNEILDPDDLGHVFLMVFVPYEFLDDYADGDSVEMEISCRYIVGFNEVTTNGTGYLDISNAEDDSETENDYGSGDDDNYSYDYNTENAINL